MPPPFAFLIILFGQLENEKPSSWSKESGVLWWSHDSVNTVMHESLYDSLVFTGSLSILLCIDLVLLKIMEDSGGLLPLIELLSYASSPAPLSPVFFHRPRSNKLQKMLRWCNSLVLPC